MADFNINIKNKLGQSGNGGNKRTVSSQREQISTIKNSNIKSLGTSANKSISSVMSGRGSSMIGKLGTMGGVVGAVIGVAIATADKGTDLFVSYQTAKTGQSIHYGNIKAKKDMILSLGTNYLYGGVKNEIFTKKVVKRQNFTNEYNREVYNLNNFGEKNKIR